jgi:predicted SAM-dependent methyltransferase
LSDETIYLNLGCGSRYHPDWVNIDIAPRGPEVIQYDISRGIPLPDASCDVVYHSAVLEHMRLADASVFMTECRRVLKPGGIVRVGVPDLEKICQIYLFKLTAALNDNEAAAHDYNWIMLEMYDQTVREKSGGGMIDYLRQNPLPNEEFVYERIGEEGRQLVESSRCKDSERKKGETPNFFRTLKKRLRNFPDAVKQRLIHLLLGDEDARALEIGRFRLAGEVHQWMFDRYSLARLLHECGFREPIVCDPASSQIPGWSDFHLDILPNGQVIKPDLLFMEAVKMEDGVHG